MFQFGLLEKAQLSGHYQANSWELLTH